MRPMPVGLTALALQVALWGCKGQPELRLPEGVSCRETLTAGPGAVALKEALGRAEQGACVVPAAGTYRTGLVVPSGVTLAAEVGTEVEVAGDLASSAAVTLSAGANLCGVRVSSAPAIGVMILRGPSRLREVVVENARSAGVVAWCEEDCRADLLSELHDVELTKSAVGLVAHGAPVKMVGGRVAEHQGTSLASGYGVVASHGGSLAMNGTVVELNQELGVLVDGDLGTAATLQNVTVRNNLGRGIWAQAIAGTALSPKLQLESCILEGNSLVGFGARASRGILIRGGRVASTVMVKAPTQPGVFVDVGDGIGLFDGSGDVRVEEVAIETNQRSQVLVDKGSTGLTVQGGVITSQPGQLGVVVQHTVERVQAPSVTVPDPGKELPISAPLLSVPSY